jgi:ATP-dependent protease Clp ATPase subunit
VTRKHTAKFDPIEVIDFAVTKMQRHFEPMKRQIDAWQGFELPDARAKAVIYDAFVAGQLQAPKKLASRVHQHYFHPQHPEFEPRTMWSLSNAFTSALGELEPVPRFRATAKLAPFLARYN